MGRPKKPTILKLANGSLRHNPSRRNPGEPAPTRGIGPAPERLTAEQRETWDEIVRICFAGVLGESDRIALEMIVVLLVEFRTGFADMNGAKMKLLESLMGRFGLTPSDRTKIVVRKAPPKNPFVGM